MGLLALIVEICFALWRCLHPLAIELYSFEPCLGTRIRAARLGALVSTSSLN